MTISGVPGVSASNVSFIANQISSLIAAVGEDGVKVTLSASPTDAVNLQHDVTNSNIGEEVIKSDIQTEQSVV